MFILSNNDIDEVKFILFVIYFVCTILHHTEILRDSLKKKITALQQVQTQFENMKTSIGLYDKKKKTYELFSTKVNFLDKNEIKSANQENKELENYNVKSVHFYAGFLFLNGACRQKNNSTQNFKTTN